MFVLAVVGAVLILHLLFEIFSTKYKTWKRKRQLLLASADKANTVHYDKANNTVSAKWLEYVNEDNLSDMEETDMEETSALIQSSGERTSVMGHDKWPSEVVVETGQREELRSPCGAQDEEEAVCDLQSLRDCETKEEEEEDGRVIGENSVAVNLVF